MHRIQREKVVPYTPEQMFELVDKVEDYPLFLPWVGETEILTRETDEVRARVQVASMGFQKSFTTCNRTQKGKMIEIRLLDGPFHHLEGFWRFDQAKENHSHCHVAFDLEFSLAGGWLNFAFGPIFHQMANNLVDAFSDRANDVYGKA